MLTKLSLRNLHVAGKKILMRVDFNVPLDPLGQIKDDTRIQASLPSIEYILKQGGTIILMSHLGRPKGQKIPNFSLLPCAKHLSMLIERPVHMALDCVGKNVEEQVQRLGACQIMLLENLRFHQAEEDPEHNFSFAQQLSKLGDAYVDDAFGTAHRKHTSTYYLPKLFPQEAAMGFLMEKEILFLEKFIRNSKKPFCAIIGGAKISTKIGLLKTLLKKVDVLLIGGAMAFTFMKAQGYAIGDSLYEPEFLSMAKDILNESQIKGVQVVLPVDHIVAQRLESPANVSIILSETGIPEGYQGFDIGPRTIQQFSEFIQKAATIFWNGPLGIIEAIEFANGTLAIAEKVAHSAATTVVGGGDSITALQKAGLMEKITYISTGGGASLKFLESGTLPGIEALSNAYRLAKKLS
ncbi:Phosphoglycerate kinase [Neochlamydia sp. AcF65]|nr:MULTISPECIES: phosphoglycerate kinase [unclassified Neochlamydia]MBS4167253.1 Phosphoglycerate kinase [Neochlamydia sp. AcF65]MBS4169667.1 Phosphoglycerate kinase [Neochlamydia sp. AcF95]NGY95178.1 Phosphoglycerate kinase [Neochlamydia sp. AcF84]